MSVVEKFQWFMFGHLEATIMCAVIMWLELGRAAPDEQWCGCDGEGMAHKPGAKGFGCAPAATPKEDSKP